MNRRNFLSSFAGVVAWVKSPKIQSISPAASAIQPTCEKPRMVRFDGILTGNGFGNDYLDHRWPGAEWYQFGGQRVFRVIDERGDDTGSAVAFAKDCYGSYDPYGADIVVTPSDLEIVTVTGAFAGRVPIIANDGKLHGFV